MADEHDPIPSPHSSSRFSLAPPVASTDDNSNGIVPKPATVVPSLDAGKRTAMPEMVLFGRWLLGCLLVFVCGWGMLALAVFLLRGGRLPYPELIFGNLAVLDLVLFLFLERHFWLSRYMGLRIEPGTHFWHSAVMLWLFGVPGLLFRPADFHTESAAQARTKSRTRMQPAPRADSAREIVETIVFVVVLVLLLKSFAAEAFVIPTGSMGQTLLGYQKDVTCPDCGLKFPINCSQEVDPSDGGKAFPVYACVCPNCRQRIHFPSAPPNYALEHPDSRLVEDPGWNSGDRVLVAKFVYDLFEKNPDRLDVVVFKYPGDERFPTTGPHRNHVPMNYIKRCIGEPGETIAIRGGKIYALSPDKGPHYDDYEKAKHDPELMATLWQKKYMHENEARERFHNGEFQIVRKKPENIVSMMRLVFDNDHPSQSDPVSTNRWKSSERSWSALTPHGFRHDAVDSGDTDWLSYRHILRDYDNKPGLVTDMMGYNTYQTLKHESPLLGNNWVGDLILECEVDLDNPQGELSLELGKGVDRFRAQWDLSTGVCTLLRIAKEGEQKLESKPTALKKKGSYRLRFANVDERLVVWVDGELPFDSGVPYSAPKELGPRKDDYEPARIGVRGAGVALHKLKLFRDTYFTVGSNPSDPDVPDFNPTEMNTWRELSHPPILTMYVQPDHFLCLGDNSPESSDGRSWGAVPRRLLLGRALLVYYPFGRAGRIR
jgi:signal peptidase I